MNCIINSIRFISAYLIPCVLYADDSKGGMPQLDPSSFISQIFWLIISFSVLFILINYYFFPKISNIQENRENLINKYITDSEKNHDESSRIEKDLNAELEKTKLRVSEIVNSSLVKNKEKFEQEILKLSSKLDKEAIKNINDLESQKNNIISNISDYSYNISNLMYEKILNEKIDISSNDFKKLLENK